MEKLTAPPKLSVVVSTYNRRDALISRSLPAIFDQDFPAEEYEVVVVVDGSTDGTGAALRELRPACALHIIEQPNRGLSAARNSAIAAARSRLVIFIDDDIVCNRDVLRKHVEAHSTCESSVVFGSLFLARGLPPSILGYANESWYQKYNARLASRRSPEWPDATFLISNCSMPRSALLACGGLDENLSAKDDFELGLRLWKRGLKFRYLPGAVAYELSVKSFRSFLFTDGKSFGRSEVLLCRKHADYRPYSQLLGGVATTSAWKRLPRRLVLQSPASAAHLLTLPIWTCEKLCRIPRAQKLGLRLLEIGRRVEELRAAVRETGSWPTFQREFAMRLPVLLYHHVGRFKPGTPPSLTVSPGRFERHVRWLARRGFLGIRPTDWARWRRDGSGLPDKPVLLSFDDGYADLVEYAFPVLRHYGFGAAVYVVTGEIGGANVWDQAKGSEAHRLMNPDQIRFWATQGIEFGAHSRTHPDLTALTASELTEEVAGSKKDLESILGSPVTSFAYPFGFHNQRVLNSVRETFDLAFAIDSEPPGLNHLATEPHLLERTMVQAGDSELDIECRVRWGYSPIQQLRGRTRLRSRARSALRFKAGGSKS